MVGGAGAASALADGGVASALGAGLGMGAELSSLAAGPLLAQAREMGLLSWLLVDLAINWAGWALAAPLKVSGGGREGCWRLGRAGCGAGQAGGVDVSPRALELPGPHHSSEQRHPSRVAWRESGAHGLGSWYDTALADSSLCPCRPRSSTTCLEGGSQPAGSHGGTGSGAAPAW